MIDLMVLQFPHLHYPFGNERIKRSEDSIDTTSKRFSRNVSLHIDGSPITVTSMDDGTWLEIRCCPLKPLQGHNVFGTNNLCAIACELIPQVFHRLRIPFAQEHVAGWAAGDFNIEALHVVQRFRLPENIGAIEMCEHMMRNLSSDYRPTSMKFGKGVRLKMARSDASWFIYDKLRELDDKRTHALKHLSAVVGKDAGGFWSHLREAAGTSIHAELNLSKQYLEQHGLGHGFAWSVKTANEVFFRELEQLRDSMTSVKPATQPLSLSAIFSSENILKPFPKWVQQYRVAGFASPQLL